MAHARRSLRNHHGKPHEHAPGDPLGEYLPPLSEWTPDASSSGRVRHWTHPALGWVFAVSGNNRLGYVRTSYSRGGKHEVRGANAHNLLREWYAAQTPASVARLAAQDPYAAIGRSAERNPDWSAIRAKASHYGSRAATGAREAYAWTAPRAKRAAEVTWEGAKSAGRAVKRGAKRAAPVVARGARSAAEGLDRWSQTNGRCAMRNGAALKWEKDGRDHVAATPFGKVVVAEYRTLDGPEWHAFLLVPEKYREGHFRRFLTAMPSLAAAKDMAEWHISRLAK